MASLLVGLSFDGRYDRHRGLDNMTDDGYVGDPHCCSVRGAGWPGRGRRSARVWVPAERAVDRRVAISVDGRALVSVDAGSARSVQRRIPVRQQREVGR